MRPLDRNHHKLGLNDLNDGDRISVWSCASTADATALERRLIKNLRPSLNGQATLRQGPRDDAYLTIRLTPVTRESLAVRAARERRTLTNLVAYLLEDAVAEGAKSESGEGA